MSVFDNHHVVSTEAETQSFPDETNQRGSSKLDAMPTIGRIGALDVMIFRNDHDPPHFHVIGPEFSAKFTIADFELLSSSGRIRRRDLRDIEEWGQNHQAELYLNWQLARAGKPPQKIVD